MIVLGPHDVLVLDLDDTLYPERAYVRSGLEAVDRWVRARWGREGFLEAAWVCFQAGSRGVLFDDALGVLELEYLSLDIEAMVATYREHEPDIHLFPDAMRLLSRAPAPSSLALITDGAAVSQRRKIAALGLSRAIATIIVTDELGRDAWKPSVVPFERVGAATGTDPSRLTYLGDNLRKDFVGPNSLGWRTVRVLRDDGIHSAPDDLPIDYLPHITIRTLDDIAWR